MAFLSQYILQKPVIPRLATQFTNFCLTPMSLSFQVIHGCQLGHFIEACVENSPVLFALACVDGLLFVFQQLAALICRWMTNYACYCYRLDQRPNY